MELNIYTSDVRDFDKEVDRKFDVSEEFGTGIFDDNDRISLVNYNYYLEPFTYISIIADMQGQINMLEKTVEHLKNKIGWVSGYDDHRFTVDKSLEARITALETALFDGKNNSEQYLYGE